jgi:acyl-CoA thioester hydrolase
MARHRFRCPLRWSDMDAYGIVNNVVFLRYLEEARVDFINRMAPPERDAFFAGGSVVVRHWIDYKHRLVHQLEPIDIDLWVTALGAATVTVDYEVKDEDTVYAVASTVMAPFDYVAGRLRRLSDAETRFFAAYLEQPMVVG